VLGTDCAVIYCQKFILWEEHAYIRASFAGNCINNRFAYTGRVRRSLYALGDSLPVAYRGARGHGARHERTQPMCCAIGYSRVGNARIWSKAVCEQPKASSHFARRNL
jgi:hypothetical protein